MGIGVCLAINKESHITLQCLQLPVEVARMIMMGRLTNKQWLVFVVVLLLFVTQYIILSTQTCKSLILPRPPGLFAVQEITRECVGFF